MLRLFFSLAVVVYSVVLAFDASSGWGSAGVILIGLIVAGVILLGLEAIESSWRITACMVATGLFGMALLSEAMNPPIPMQVSVEGMRLFGDLHQAFYNRDFDRKLVNRYQKRFLMDCEVQRHLDQADLAFRMSAAVYLPPETELLAPLLEGNRKPELHPCKQLMQEVVRDAPPWFEKIYPEITKYGKLA